MTYTTYNLDCRGVMDLYLEDNSVDAIVTDPPYGLSFMGRHWDHGVPGVEFWERAFRVLKPGGHLLAFGGPRTYHRLTCAIEDAGFEIRESCMWLFAQGFPKSLNISKAIDKAAGAEREVTEVIYNYSGEKRNCMAGDYSGNRVITAPATDAAKQWEGWGSALKPAHEPICVARKPFPGTLANNVLQWGVGGLNIDKCRVGTEIVEAGRAGRGDCDGYSGGLKGQETGGSSMGRWPANVIHDGSDEVLALFPDSKGQLAATGSRTQGALYGAVDAGVSGIQPRNDAGSAARYFYCSKASKKDRDGSTHPTMKPTDLMRYLCRLVTPPGGIVLDPFMGSGSTGKAALREGFRFIGCELEAEYHAIAQARLKAAL